MTCWCGEKFIVIGGDYIGLNRYTQTFAVCNDCEIYVSKENYDTIEDAVKNWLYQTWPVLING